MQLSHIKCALEVERTGSITQAADNLYMGQPNLSRVIREIEDEVGARIFNRGSRGVTVTEAGREFLKYAHEIASSLEGIDRIKFRHSGAARIHAVVSGADPITECAAHFADSAASGGVISISLSEADTRSIIGGVSDKAIDLGIVRVSSEYESIFRRGIKERRIDSLCLWDFEMRVIMSSENPLTKKDLLDENDLKGLLEIISGNDFSRRRESLPRRYVRTDSMSFCYPILGRNDSFMLAAPVKEDVLKRYSLAQRQLLRAPRCKYFLIWHRDYTLTESDIAFRTYLCGYFAELEKECL